MKYYEGVREKDAEAIGPVIDPVSSKTYEIHFFHFICMSFVAV